MLAFSDMAINHSGEGKAIVGIAKVVTEGYADPTATEGDWCAVDLAPAQALVKAVTLAALKADNALADLAVVRKPRISVVRSLPAEVARILKMAQTRP